MFLYFESIKDYNYHKKTKILFNKVSANYHHNDIIDGKKQFLTYKYD